MAFGWGTFAKGTGDKIAGVTDTCRDDGE